MPSAITLIAQPPYRIKVIPTINILSLPLIFVP
jgi:hypothetical protein